MRQRLKREGADAGKGFGEAGEEMDAAGEALKRGGHGEAVDAQGRALEQLRRSAQDLARQMAEADGARQGAAGRDGEGGEDSGRGAASGDRPQTDPLGRPLRGVDRGLGRMETGETGEAAGERARRILDELRRRLGERQREREELDYLERLLGPR
ncbi:DUF4175 family protein [Camelimonas abortus]|uniref:DUF4175 family protein n=1 Tax=Camelimonas abortus TaxID=1017184 RepID=A0ABV7LC28_9HYPH